MKQTYQYQNKTFELELTPSGKGWRASLGQTTVDAQILHTEGEHIYLLIDGKPVTATLTLDGTRRWVTILGQTLLFTKVSSARPNNTRAALQASQILAPMPGQVRAVQTAQGDTVKKGQTLLVIEAMKMEIKLAAPFDGLVKKLSVKVGQTVEREQILAEITPELKALTALD